LRRKFSSLASRRRSLFARVFILGLAAYALGVAYFVLLPGEAEARASALGAAPVVFAVGALLGSAIWIVDRIWPRAFNRVGSWAIGPEVFLAVGVLILIGEDDLFLVVVGIAGFVFPVVTPLARFPAKVNKDHESDSRSQL
jgi:hypothetical protein